MKTQTAPRKTKSETIEDIQIHSVELDFMTATDLLPDLLAIIGPAAGVEKGQITYGEAAAAVSYALVGGKLTALLPRILCGTSMIIPGEGQFDLVSREAINKALTGRKKFIFPLVKIALEVSFADFLGGLALIGIKLPKLPTRTPSPSEDFSPSTSATG